MIINLHNVHYPAHASEVINILYIGAIISTFMAIISKQRPAKQTEQRSKTVFMGYHFMASGH